jgi:hypothetical protein
VYRLYENAVVVRQDVAQSLVNLPRIALAPNRVTERALYHIGEVKSQN